MNETLAARRNREQICTKVTSGQERIMPYRATITKQGHGDRSHFLL
jgi:hypothetical protein